MVRLTAAEKKRLQREAKKENITMSALIRQRALEGVTLKNIDERLKNIFDHITPERIEQYLVSKGWKLHRLQPKRLGTRLYNSPKVRYAQIEVPLERGIYYPQSVYHIIKHLSELERRDAESILGQMITLDFDDSGNS